MGHLSAISVTSAGRPIRGSTIEINVRIVWNVE